LELQSQKESLSRDVLSERNVARPSPRVDNHGRKDQSVVKAYVESEVLNLSTFGARATRQLDEDVKVTVLATFTTRSRPEQDQRL
jgi:hypothetical protein